MKEFNLRRLFALLKGAVPPDFLRYCLGISFDAISNTSTFNQAISALRQSRPDSKKEFIHLKAAVLYASTLPQCLTAHAISPVNSPEAEDALEEIINHLRFDVNRQKLFDIAEYLMKPEKFGWGEREQLMKAWNKASLRVLKQCKSAKECLEVYDTAPEFSPARVVILKKYCTFATRAEIISFLKNCTNVPSEIAVLATYVHDAD